MMHNIPKPDVSPDFTIEDIHKVREWHYETLKDATPQERAEFYNAGARTFEQNVERRKVIAASMP